MWFKVFWVLRAVIYKIFFGGFKLPSYIGTPVFLYGVNKIFIGKKVRIYPHIRLEVHGENSYIKIKDDVAIGQNVHITSGGSLVIGKSSTILANVFITNIDHEYKEIGKHVLEQPMKIKETQIGENCFIGIGSAIQAGTILGKHCVVGANSVVRGIFPDYCVIVGAPAKIVKKYNFETQRWEKI
ncbi:acyltransferase [Myroides odoratimimus]|uniref:acyltransferase n=1 Tax=Myroides odoratimimus TaxID=76832 RepID=UPI0029C0C7A0|nr:acyltransferase [Myroides odoratimimus]MDX4975370.1 acyltransferase [Myroides odoratimimus]